MSVPSRDSAPARWPSAEEIRRRLVALLAAELRMDAGDVDVDRPITAYGFDSVIGVSVAGDLEEWLGTSVASELAWDRLSIAGLAERLASLHADTRPAAVSPGWLEGTAAYGELLARGMELVRDGLPNPFFRQLQGPPGAVVHIDGRAVVNFATYDYLGLATHPDVRARVHAAVEAYGTSASASRVASGERPIHAELEGALAATLGTEDAVTFVGGHATNVSAIGHLLGPGDWFVHDARMHNSALLGAQLAGARRVAFPHNDWRALDRLLTAPRDPRARVLVAIEGVYSVDGDVPDLPAFVEVKRRHGAWILVDEAHSMGVLGETGRGLREHYGLAASDVEVWMGTLSKALASCGGYIAGSRALCEFLRYTCGGFVFAAGMSPANAAAALGSLEVLAREPERVARLRVAGRRFLERARARGLDVRGGAGAVASVRVGDVQACVRASQALLERGLNVLPLLPPAVDPGDARLRFFLTSEHTEAQLGLAADATAEVLDVAPGSRPSVVWQRGDAPGPIVVTGGNGFIGSAVVRRLVEAGQRVRLLLRAQSNTDRLAGLAFERVIGDVRDAPSVQSALRGASAVIHLAGLSSWRDIESDQMHAVVVGGTANVLAAAAAEGVGRVVHCSSSIAVNGSETPQVFHEQSACTIALGRYAYARAKVEAERLCRRAVAAGASVTIVNPCEVYGPNDTGLITSGNLIDFVRARPAMVCEGGTSIVHVDDVAEGILASLERGRPGERYILGGENLTVRALAELTQTLAGVPVRAATLPRPLIRAVARVGGALRLPLPFEPAVIPYASLYWFMDSSKATRELGVRFRPAREVLAPTVAWLREVGHLAGG